MMDRHDEVMLGLYGSSISNLYLTIGSWIITWIYLVYWSLENE